VDVNQDGSFALDHVPPGRVEVVMTDWYAKMAHPDIRPDVIRQVVVENGKTVRVDFDAATGVMLVGRIVGWEKPLLMEARRLGGDEQGAIAGASYTDREGRFRIPHLRAGRYRIASTVGQPGYAIAIAAEVTIGTEPPDELVIEVPGHTIEGRVVDSTQQGIPRAIVTLVEAEDPSVRRSICLTDGEGRFAIGGIEEGHFTLQARARGYATTLVADYQAPGPEAILMLLPEARLRVLVQDDAGVPLPGATVRLANSREQTLHWQEVAGVDGSVTFPNLQAIPHLVAASLDGYLPADPLVVPLHEGRTDAVTLVLRRTGSLEVLLHDDVGRPLPGKPVVLSDEDGNQLATQTTDKKGMALFEDLAPAWYEVAAGPGGSVSDAIEVEPGERATLELTLAQ
jgi:uncharacterized surface anchored protein